MEWSTWKETRLPKFLVQFLAGIRCAVVYRMCRTQCHVSWGVPKSFWERRPWLIECYANHNLHENSRRHLIPTLETITHAGVFKTTGGLFLSTVNLQGCSLPFFFRTGSPKCTTNDVQCAPNSELPKLGLLKTRVTKAVTELLKAACFYRVPPARYDHDDD